MNGPTCGSNAAIRSAKRRRPFMGAANRSDANRRSGLVLQLTCPRTNHATPTPGVTRAAMDVGAIMGMGIGGMPERFFGDDVRGHGRRISQELRHPGWPKGRGCGQKGWVRRVMAWMMVCGLAVTAGWWGYAKRHGRERKYDGMIREVARLHGLPPALVKAVIWRESAFESGARGGAGELGLMQVTEGAAQEWADARQDRAFRFEHVLDPRTNLHAGCHYLAKVTRRYLKTDHPYAYGLADYNAGRGNVLRWMQGTGRTNASAFLVDMTYPGTREYVQSILRRAERYDPDFR